MPELKITIYLSNRHRDCWTRLIPDLPTQFLCLETDYPSRERKILKVE